MLFLESPRAPCPSTCSIRVSWSPLVWIEVVRVSAARRLKACFYDRSFLLDLRFSEGAFMLYLRHTGLAVAAKGNPWQSMVKMLFPLLSALMGDSF